MTPRLRLFRLFALTLLTCSLAFTRGDSAAPSPAHPAEPRTILFFGDSLTAGYGLDDPATEAYPALIRQKIEAPLPRGASSTPD